MKLPGRVAEWSKALALKARRGEIPLVSSNLTPSEVDHLIFHFGALRALIDESRLTDHEKKLLAEADGFVYETFYRKEEKHADQA